MPIIDEQTWQQCQDNNQDSYGRYCVDCARLIMQWLDEREGAVDADALIREADQVHDGGLTGFQAGCVASIVSQLHSRGQEFRDSWNQAFGQPPGKEGTVNPAIITVEVPEED